MDSIKKKKLFLFDIDGTIAVGNTLYKGSRELLSHIERIGGKSYFITNNSTKSGADYVLKFASEFSLEAEPSDFVTSGTMTLQFLTQHYMGQMIYVLGTSSYVEELRKNKLTVTEVFSEEIACIVVAYDSELTYEKLCIASKVLQTLDVPYYATNPDLRCPIDYGFIPDCGSICKMLEDTTQKTPVYLGKPSREIVFQCMNRSGFSADETIVVGDRLYTDIACGMNAGVKTALVLTGEAKKEDLEKTLFYPDYVFDTIYDLYLTLQN